MNVRRLSVEQCEDKETMFLISSSFPEATYPLDAGSQENCQLWISHIQKAMESAEKNKVLGRPLSELLAGTGKLIPSFLQKSIDFVEENADLEGIFRVSASVIQLHLEKEKINHGLDISFDKTSDPSLAAALIKAFIIELPEPLPTLKFISEVEKLPNDDSSCDTIKNLLKGIPECNAATLLRILECFNKVVQKVDKNKMTASNLAIVFSQSLRLSNEKIAFLIENFSKLR